MSQSVSQSINRLVELCKSIMVGLLPTTLLDSKLVQLPLQMAEQAFELCCDDKTPCKHGCIHKYKQ